MDCSFSRIAFRSCFNAQILIRCICNTAITASLLFYFFTFLLFPYHQSNALMTADTASSSFPWASAFNASVSCSVFSEACFFKTSPSSFARKRSASASFFAFATACSFISFASLTAFSRISVHVASAFLMISSASFSVSLMALIVSSTIFLPPLLQKIQNLI